MAIIRSLLAAIILLIDKLTTPRSVVRDAASQQKIDEQTQALTLYQYLGCPFCVKVRRALKRQGLSVETRDAKRDPEAKEELLAGGGRLQVPCLKIQQSSGQEKWLYESQEIIDYLVSRFAAA